MAKKFKRKKNKLKSDAEAIAKEFGDSVLVLDPDSADEVLVKGVPSFSTGSMALDLCLGTGGVPVGRIVEVFGPEAGGKTTLALHIVAACQQEGKLAAYIDAEHALDLQYAKKIGVDTSALLFSQPDNGEQALQLADKFCSKKKIKVVVVDSVAALIPKAELEGEIGETKGGMALHARLMSQSLRRLNLKASKSNTLVIFINQIREKPGVMFGNPETTTGGNALKFYASTRLRISRSKSIKKGTKIIGFNTKVQVAKNKLSAPYRTANLQLLFSQGFEEDFGVADALVTMNLCSKSKRGLKILFGDQKGEFLEEDSEELVEFAQEILEDLKD
jgi:recombination protein RecA